jgi:hypothetical protein
MLYFGEINRGHERSVIVKLSSEDPVAEKQAGEEKLVLGYCAFQLQLELMEECTGIN